MNKKIRTMAALVIASAIIWAAVIIGSALALRGTECYSEIQNILTGGVLAHIILIWGPTVVLFTKKKDNMKPSP